MPYGISNTQSDCSGWATVKQAEDGSYETIGCHVNKQDAVDQMVAVSIEEDIEPLGEIGARDMMEGEMDMMEEECVVHVSVADVIDVVEENDLTPRDAALYEAYEQIAEEFGMWTQADAHYIEQSPFAEQGMKCLNCSLFVGGNRCEIVEGEIATEAICKLWVIRQNLLTDQTTDERSSREVRAVDLSAPAFMRNNAKRGLKYYEEGLAGDGLKPQTVADARKMASGEVTEAKWRKIAPWVARHLVDLEAEGVAEGEITAGVVAHYLWGSGATKRQAQRTLNYAQRIIDQLDEEQRMHNLIEQTTTNHWVVADHENEQRRIAFSNMEVRASNDGTKLIGYAAVFDSPSEPLPWTEFVKRGAFTKTINDGADVRLLIDHEGVPLARTTSGTLTLREDDRGLLVESDLDPANPDAARLISALRRGDISQMSFAFRTIKDSWNADRSVRELREVQLFDVSVVTFPAYEATVAELRARRETVIIPETNKLALRKAQIQIARHK